MDKQLDSYQQAAYDLFDDLEASVIKRKMMFHCHSVGFWGRVKDVLRRGSRNRVYEGTGLYLHGGVGRGKTMLMDNFFDNLKDKDTKKRFHYHDFMKLIHEAFHFQREQEGDQGVFMDRTTDAVLGRNCHVLCLDEMEVTDITDAMLMARLFKELVRRKTVLVITSNVALADLYKDGLQRDLFVPFIEMMENYVQSFFLGDTHDYRFDGFEGEFWFCGQTDETEKSLLKLYEGWKMVGGVEEYALKIGLASRGRWIEAKFRGEGKVWLSFQALCEASLGSRDFIKLARKFRYMVIEGVPSIENLRVDVLRRFVVLVDVLYDEGVTVCLSSTSEKKQISIQDYFRRTDGGRYGVERMVSRLQEMLSIK